MKNINEYILSQLKTSTSQRDNSMLFWFIDRLNYDELCSLQEAMNGISETVSMHESFTYDWGLILRLRDKIWMAKNRCMGGNKPIVEVLEAYKESRSEELVEELTSRFPKVAFEEQKLILKSLFELDNEIELYSLMNDSWAPMFIKELEHQWLVLDNPNATEYVIRHSSEEFLLEHAERFSKEPYFHFIAALRLGNNPAYRVDIGLLHDKWEYYALQCVLGRGIDRREMLLQVFKAVKEALSASLDTFRAIEEDCLRFGSHYEYVSIVDIPEINQAVRAMEKAQLDEELCYLYNWDAKVCTLVAEAMEEMMDNSDEEMSLWDKWRIYRDIAVENFPADLMPVADMTEERERLEKFQELMSGLGLGVIDNPFDSFNPRTIDVPSEIGSKLFL